MTYFGLRPTGEAIQAVECMKQLYSASLTVKLTPTQESPKVYCKEGVTLDVALAWIAERTAHAMEFEVAFGVEVVIGPDNVDHFYA